MFVCVFQMANKSPQNTCFDLATDDGCDEHHAYVLVVWSSAYGAEGRRHKQNQATRVGGRRVAK